MRILAMVLMLGLSASVMAQAPSPSDGEEIVVKGIPNGARVVEVSLDRVSRQCAECKRALKKLERLAQTYHEELKLAGESGASAGDYSPIGTFQRSSSNLGPSTPGQLARQHPSATRGMIYQHMVQNHVIPERMKMDGHIRSFLDQLMPHIVEATESERVARDARVSLIGRIGDKIPAKKVVRVDVTDAVINRLNAKDFTIELPEPPASAVK